MLKSHTRAMCLLFLAAFALSLCPGASTAQILEDIAIVDSPTAGILPHGGYLLQGCLGPRSSILIALKVGFFDRLMIGASYGFQEFFDRGDMKANDLPGFEARLRIIEESERGPALALGIDTQGEDIYIEDWARYVRKSKGIYAVLSKNYRLIGDFSVHGGVNYSFENRDENGLNAFCASSLEIVGGFSILLDYNAALDDNDEDIHTHLTRGKGYLDAGLRFDYRDNLRIKIFFKDLLDNYVPASGVERSMEIFYVNSF